ncbi:hypothetical protein [Marinomonas atlantica]|uniref:hypothetical protein n=1 Tax=Marinomonas atlantica TaxID=1806668 RepID=UPI000830AC0A|nr:hypothetical protein [Marinomonas atlantica]
MNIIELTNKLNGTQYPLRISSEMRESLKKSNLLIIYGASDDLIEFDGAFRDEVGVHDGGHVLIHREGILGNRDELDTDDELMQWLDHKAASKEVEAVWCNGEFSWSYKTQIPHTTFEILDGEEKYCLGMVISTLDI